MSSLDTESIHAFRHSMIEMMWRWMRGWFFLGLGVVGVEVWHATHAWLSRGIALGVLEGLLIAVFVPVGLKLHAAIEHARISDLESEEREGVAARDRENRRVLLDDAIREAYIEQRMAQMAQEEDLHDTLQRIADRLRSTKEGGSQ